MDSILFPSSWWEECIILESDGRFALIDAGLAGSGARIAALLKARGAERLEFVLITHYHNDHFGGLPYLLDAFPIGTVYQKAYSNREASGGGGGGMSDQDRAASQEEYLAYLANIRKKSHLAMIGRQTGPLRLGRMTLTLFNRTDIIREMYENEKSEYRGQFVFNENNNSVTVLVEHDGGASAFLTSDCYDEPLSYEPGRALLTKAARAIGHPVNLYKLPHHGCGDFTSEETAALLRPDFVTTTNDAQSMEKDARFSESPRKLKEANPAAVFSYPIGCCLQYTMEDGGKMTLSVLPE